MAWSLPDRYIWDFWFAEKNGENHVFFLQANKEHCKFDPQQRHDLASLGHAVQNNRGWQLLSPDPAFSKSRSGAWDDLSLWSGSIIKDPKSAYYYLFYTSRCSKHSRSWTPKEWQYPQHIGIARSENLSSWRRLEQGLYKPLIPNPVTDTRFDHINWRDPYVIYHNDRYHCFITARRRKPNGTIHPDGDGVIAHLSSTNIERWSGSDIHIFHHSQEFYQMEVPQVFWRSTKSGKRLYLIFSAEESDCSSHRRKLTSLAQCRTGSYYMFSHEVAIDYKGWPPLREPAHLLAPNLFAGKILNPETQSQPELFGFPVVDQKGQFAGGIENYGRVNFLDSGLINIDRKQNSMPHAAL